MFDLLLIGAFFHFTCEKKIGHVWFVRDWLGPWEGAEKAEIRKRSDCWCDSWAHRTFHGNNDRVTNFTNCAPRKWHKKDHDEPQTTTTNKSDTTTEQAQNNLTNRIIHNSFVLKQQKNDSFLCSCIYWWQNKTNEHNKQQTNKHCFLPQKKQTQINTNKNTIQNNTITITSNCSSFHSKLTKNLSRNHSKLNSSVFVVGGALGAFLRHTTKDLETLRDLQSRPTTVKIRWSCVGHGFQRKYQGKIQQNIVLEPYLIWCCSLDWKWSKGNRAPLLRKNQISCLGVVSHKKKPENK